MNKSFRNEGALKSSAIARGNDITESMFAKSYLCRLRKGPFEGPANAKPPALPEVMTVVNSVPSLEKDTLLPLNAVLIECSKSDAKHFVHHCASKSLAINCCEGTPAY